MLDVAVLGGGLIGCAIAHRLARDGARVALFERGEIGAEASGAAAGMLGAEAEMDDARLRRAGLASRALYPEWLASLQGDGGVVVEWWRNGSLLVALTAADERLLAARREPLTAQGGGGETVGAGQIRALEPALSRRVRGGILYVHDARVDNVALTRAAAAAAARVGCALHAHEPVQAVTVERGRATGVRTARRQVACGTVINALGAWAGRVRGTTPVPVQPVRGQIAVLQAQRPLFRHAVLSPRGYAVARRDGRILLGSTREAAGYEKRCTAGGIGGILAAALELAPGLAALPWTASWAGLRPGSADGQPLVGCDPAVQGYLVATGHDRHGVLLAPLTVGLVADLLAGRPNAWEAAWSPVRVAAAACVDPPRDDR